MLYQELGEMSEDEIQNLIGEVVSLYSMQSPKYDDSDEDFDD